MTGRDVGDIIAGTTAFGTIISFLPQIAALLSIIWVLIRIFEWSRIRIFKLKPTKGI